MDRIAAVDGARVVTPTPFSVTFTTANLYSRMSRAKTQRAYSILTPRCDFLGTVEMQNRRAASFVKPDVWGTLQTKRGDARARCALHYRLDRFQLYEWDVQLLHDSRLFRSAERWFVWGTFRDQLTGRWVSVSVHHWGPHYDAPSGGITPLPRGRLARKSIDVTTGWARDTWGNAVVMGDFNIDAAKDLRHKDPSDLIESFRRAGLRSVAQLQGEALDTFGRRRKESIDQGFVRIVPGAGEVTRQWTTPTPSNHHAYSFTVAFTKRRLWAEALAAA